MTTIEAVIVDDEPLARRALRQLLAPHGDVEVVGEARDGEEAVRIVRALAPDLVFLDIQLPELDGLEVLRRLAPGPLPEVIFVTAYDRFAVRAFEVHAVDYLVKPVEEARFEAALARARDRLRAGAAVELADRLGRLLATGLGRDRLLALTTATGELVLEPSEIDWIEAADDGAAVHALGRRHLARESLASLEARLDPARFVRVHRSALVNLARVRELRGDTAVLRDGSELAISRRRREQVAAALRRLAR